jgi:hypothetical protein
MDGSFSRSNLTDFFKSFNQRMIMGEQIHLTIWVNRVGTAIANVSDDHLVSHDEGSSECGPTTHSGLFYGFVGS